MKKMSKILSLLMALCMVVSLFAGCGAKEDPAPEKEETKAPAAEQSGEKAPAPSGDVIFDGEATVYFMYPDSATPRWETFDGPFIQEYLSKYAPNVEMKMVDAEGDAQKQLQQVEAAISSGCDFMIFIPAEEEQAAGSVNVLNAEGVPFASMCHTPFGAEVPIFMTMPFDMIAKAYVDYMEENIISDASGYPYKIAYIGGPDSNFYYELSAVYEEAFKRWESEGKAEVVFNVQTDSWSAASAQGPAEQMLTQTGNDIDIVITNNDDLNAGVLAALNEQGLVGDVHVLGGCDVTMQGLAHVQEGWQEGDIMPDYETMGATMAKIVATYLATGEYPMDLVNSSTNNNFMNDGIPTISIPALLITKDNMKELIVDMGVASQADIDAIANTLK
ncbi:MAG: substrate-binding domain-containing protein [Oscillibacter sp.]|nr:substrate-binding domain-containing protein [Oscillibacter sp.]